ncbi:methyltransferase domain-containing protein [Nocardia sp. NPDC004123]
MWLIREEKDCGMSFGDDTGFGDEVGGFLITSRGLDEYRAMFGLGPADLGGRILDCPAGAASFAAEVAGFGGDVTACDAAYFDFDGVEVGEVCRAQTDLGDRYVRAHPGDYCWTFFTDPDDHHRRRRSAVELFVADRQRNPDRYVPAELPRLPFPDNAFDLVLSSHLLFSYADGLGYDFHVRTITELIRVSRGDVRIFPLVPTGSAQVYPRLNELRGDLLNLGITSDVVEVEYEFQQGADQMMVCRKDPRDSE